MDADTEVLVRRAQGGDDRAVAKLLAQYAPLLSKTARKISERTHDDLDGQSKAFMAFSRALSAYNPARSSFTAYLTTACENVFKDSKKQMSRLKNAPTVPLTDTQAYCEEAGTIELLELREYRDSWRRFCEDAPADEPTICYAIISSHEASGHWKRKFCVMAAEVCGFSFGQGSLFDDDWRDTDEVRAELSARLFDDGWRYILMRSESKVEAVRRDLNLSREAIRAMQTLLAAWAADQTELLEVVSE